jgi:hypothetical protein
VTHEPPTGWDASAHPGLERLAELEEGLLDSTDASRVAEHIADCTYCHEQQAQLTRTRAVLGGLPDEPMPADVAARLDAALAEAAGQDGSVAALAPPATPTTVVPLDAKRRRWRIHPAAAGLGAAAAVAAIATILVVGHNSGGSGGGSSQQNSAEAPAAADSVLTGLTSTASGTDYTNQNVDSTVPPLVGAPQLAMSKVAPRPNTGAGTRLTPKAGVPAALAHLHDSPDALRSCILGVEAGGSIQKPLALDFAHYQGKPSLLVVLPGLSAGFVDAWFVAPACNEKDAHLLGYKAIPSPGSGSSASPSPTG